MRLIDALKDGYASLAAKGYRASAWRLDKHAIAQLRREAAEDGFDVQSIQSPATFLGVPIQEVDVSARADTDYVPAFRRFVPCKHDHRPTGRKWDIFDLDEGVALGAFYRSQNEADAASVALHAE